ncbi:MAG: DUF456 family protein [Nitriliruptor sp.]|uniref:DUF456 family protein n=1 Tax=Nitriliruptor sp. TaxID=2448056 RepID=UPI0034A011CA
MSDAVIIGLTLGVMLVGLVGVVVPVLPGVVLVGLAGIVATFALGIDTVGWVLVVVLAVVTLAGAGASYALPAQRGLKGDAARSSLALAAVLGVVGFFVIPVVGLILGALLGLYLGEVGRHGDRTRAWASTRSVLKAYGVGVLVEMGAALLLIAIWLVTTLVRL